MPTAFLALGSNLGDREQTLDRALERLRAEPHVRLLQFSSYYETPAVGGPVDSPPYFNAVCSIETTLDPETLLKRLLEIEAEFGRIRCEKDAPRTLDLDLLLYDFLVRNRPDPIVPHPRMHERRFVLEPLCEIAPEQVHPKLQRSMQDLLRSLPNEANSSRRVERVALKRLGNELEGHTSVVTGSSSGIGRAIALELAQHGAKVILHGRQQSSEQLHLLADQIRQLNTQTEVILANFADAEQIEPFVERAFAFGPVHSWINNAGADTLTGAKGKASFEEKLQTLLTVDLTATMRLSRMAGERMEALGGSILTMGWDQAETGMEGDSGQLFAAVKGAVICFTRSLAKSLAPQVRVNCLAPGWIRTLWGETASEIWQDRVRDETPLKRWGLPEDVARMARYLVSPSARFLTGQVFRVNGGVV